MTHLRLDRGVYGGVGFSRDLSVREWKERWHEDKTYTVLSNVRGVKLMW